MNLKELRAIHEAAARDALVGYDVPRLLSMLLRSNLVLLDAASALGGEAEFDYTGRPINGAAEAWLSLEAALADMKGGDHE